MAARKEVLRCSFCGRAAAQVAQLVPGPGVNICDQCVEICRQMLTQAAEPQPAAAAATVASTYSSALAAVIAKLLPPPSVRSGAATVACGRFSPRISMSSAIV